jgi:hypothetical protein
MARQHGSRATRSPSATHFGEEAVRNLERGHTGTRLPKAVRLVSIRARQHTACPRPTDPFGGASEQARRTDNDDVHRASSGARTASSAPSATTQRPQLRLPAAGVGAHRDRRPLRGRRSEALPGRQRAPSARPVRRSSAARPPRGGRQRKRARVVREAGILDTGTIRQGFGRAQVDEGCCGAPQASAVRPKPGSAAKVGEGALRCEADDGVEKKRAAQRCVEERSGYTPATSWHTGQPGGRRRGSVGHSFGSGPAPPTQQWGPVRAG